MRQYLIAYDVSSVAVRNAVARKLEKVGRRLQKSVFMARVTREAAKSLERELQNIIEEDDLLLIVPLCEKCLGEGIWTGRLLPVMVFP